ncbi:MAG: serine hydrolase domain-containing protein, partial [Planctomycetota bacterium]
HLSTHRSGLPRMPVNINHANANDPYNEYDAALGREFLGYCELIGRPGGTYQYSNLGVSLLGQWIADLQETTYEKLLQQRIAGPLKTKDLTITLTESQKKRFAAPHRVYGVPGNPWNFAMPGAGGIRANIRDMMTFAAANLDCPDNDLGRAMQLAWKKHRDGGGGTPFAMGLGWHISRDGKTRWHNGQTGSYQSMMLINRELKCAVVVLSNTASAPQVDQLGEQLIQLCAGATIQPQTIQAPTQVSAEAMQRLVGKYALTPFVVFTVSIQDGNLMVEITNQAVQRVFPTSDTHWAYRGVDASLDFKLPDDGGPASELILNQFGIQQNAKRVPEKK